MVGHYEDLRRQVLSPTGVGRGGRGVVLFLRQGMKAWMDAWLGCVTAGPTKVPLQSDSRMVKIPELNPTKELP